MVKFPHQFCDAMNYALPLTLALAALVAACAPVQPASRQVVFVDARSGCRYAIATDGHRIDVRRCAQRRRGLV